MNGSAPSPEWPQLREDDPRLHLSDAEKQAAQPVWVARFFVDLKRRPDPDVGLDTQILHGENLLKVESADGWAKIQRGETGMSAGCRRMR